MIALDSPRTTGQRVDRWSLVVFVVVVVLAVPLLLYLGRDQWFRADDWYVIGDGADSLDGYFAAHNGHWVTVVTIAHSVSYRLWGLHTYLPYQVPVVLAHVGSAVLLRILMRQLGVRGWIATAGALVFVFFGSGSLNIFFGFQISETGSVFCGLAYFVLANRDGPIDRRDWLALAVGLVGLMTSAVFVPMVVGVGVAVLIRRGPRLAAFYTVPLGLVYGVWYLLYGHEDSVMSFSAPGDALRFVARMLTGTFTALAGSDVAGIALGLLVLGTLGTISARALRTRQWTPLALPAGLIIAWVVFAGLTALARASWIGAPDAGRYLHITAALFLPLIALGTEHVARRNVLVGALPILLLTAGLPTNLDRLVNRNPAVVLGSRDAVVWLAHSEYIDDVPPDLEPIPAGLTGLPVTAGWLSREANAGHIPEPAEPDAAKQLSAYGLLALRQEWIEDVPNCPPAGANRLALTLADGDRIVFEGDLRIRVRDGQDLSNPLTFQGLFGGSIGTELGPLDLEIRGVAGKPPRLCEPRP